ncbi:hypothetical protein [Roseovarius phycicola]|uniref:Uncharacterized protein n=1 Tax=Roseovarius phycicola TaxID=3080976 RepID=A0ABZ2HD78_9RHOB
MTRKTQKPIKAKLAPDHPLFEVIEQAYTVFRYPRPTDTGVCQGCCMYPEIEKDFFNPPIRELPLHYLNDWFFAACDPPLSKSLWGYFLPRILEVLACGEDVAFVGLEVSLSRFPTGDKTQWSKAEWAALDNFQRQYLAHFAEGSETGDYLDDVLCMFGQADWPMDDLFQQVWEMPDEVLALRLWRDWCVGKAAILVTAFWDKGRNTNAFNFYTSRKLYERMERLALNDTTPGDLAEKALAVASVIQDSAYWAHK